MGDIFINENYWNGCEDLKSFTKNFVNMRRRGEISGIYNIYPDLELDFVYIDGTAGRVRRPLIIVEKGKPKVSLIELKELTEEKILFSDLVKMGKIEYLDAMEENSKYVALNSNDLTVEHTHMEITPVSIFGFVCATIPYLGFAEPSRTIRGLRGLKQAMGMFATNFLQRYETDRNVLLTPQRPLVQTYIYDLLNFQSHASGQNLVIAVMSFEGYNIEGGLIFNESSIERGLQRSSYYKLYKTFEIKYPGGVTDRITIPEKDVKGYRTETSYSSLDDDGITYVGKYVKAGDVLIGKVSPPRFGEELEGFGQMINLDIDTSVIFKEVEGIVSAINIVENLSGDKEVNILLREMRNPIIGDKFSSRLGQKGIIGAVFKQADLPFSESGLIPDLIFSPFSIPSRKSVAHIMEILAGKVSALKGSVIDATAFEKEEDLANQLEKYGFKRSGKETMYDPKNGRKIEADIYIGSMYYLRLKHQVKNKIQARGIGPVQLLTRQPAEGRIREGGLKLGEMEKDALISHGASLLLKERFSSDQTTAFICMACGNLADPLLFRYSSKCPMCGSSKFDEVELAYAFKLFINELRSMGINPSFLTKDRFTK